jgi:hypothetical protein
MLLFIGIATLLIPELIPLISGDKPIRRESQTAHNFV